MTPLEKIRLGAKVGFDINMTLHTTTTTTTVNSMSAISQCQLLLPDFDHTLKEYFWDQQQQYHQQKPPITTTTTTTTKTTTKISRLWLTQFGPRSKARYLDHKQQQQQQQQNKNDNNVT